MIRYDDSEEELKGLKMIGIYGRKVDGEIVIAELKTKKDDAGGELSFFVKNVRVWRNQDGGVKEEKLEEECNCAWSIWDEYVILSELLSEDGSKHFSSVYT